MIEAGLAAIQADVQASLTVLTDTAKVAPAPGSRRRFSL
jgi:hypothetical protein